MKKENISSDFRINKLSKFILIRSTKHSVNNKGFSEEAWTWEDAKKEDLKL